MFCYFDVVFLLPIYIYVIYTPMLYNYIYIFFFKAGAVISLDSQILQLNPSKLIYGLYLGPQCKGFKLTIQMRGTIGK